VRRSDLIKEEIKDYLPQKMMVGIRLWRERGVFDWKCAVRLRFCGSL